MLFIHVQVVITVSAPSERKRKRGKRLTKKASLIAVLTLARAQPGVVGSGVNAVRSGYVRRPKMPIRLDVIIRGEGGIAATWICTKSFWFLRPTDELLSFRS